MYLDENGVWRDKTTGNIQYMFDFVKTKPYVPRYYDRNTKNTSFYNMAVLLRELGVKNYEEHLQIFNPQLIGVDPHSPLLTDGVRMMIDKECRMNPWYVFREVFKVSIGTNKTFFDLNISNYTAIWLMIRCQDFLQEAPRQTGKTYTATDMLAYVINFGGKNFKMTNIHYDEVKAKDNIGLIRDALDSLPSYLQYHKKELSKPDPKTGKLTMRNRLESKGSSRVLDNRLFNNVISTVVVGQDEDKARKAGRGSTNPILFIDEFAFIKHNYTAMASIGQATSTARKIARENGLINGIWTLTTPGFLNTEHGKWIYENIKNEYITMTKDMFFIFDMTIEELESWKETKGISTFFYLSYTYDEIGYDEEWLYSKGRSESVETINREILLKWEQNIGNNPFSKALLNALTNKAKTVKGVKSLFRGQEFLLYNYKGYPYQGNDLISFLKFNYRDGVVIGVDIAYGYGGNHDKSTMVFVDKRTARIIATYGNNTINVDDYLILIMTMMKEFKANGLRVAFSIERNSPGESIIAALKKLPEYQDMIVAFPVSQNKLSDPTSIIDTNVIFGNKRIPSDYGFRVTGGKQGTRGILMNILSTLVEKYTSCISVPVIVQEIETLTVNKTKTDLKIEASDGTHDDYVMGMLHAYNALMNNSKFLEVRNHIKVDSTQFLINDNIEIVDVSGTSSNKRIQTIYEQRNGSIIINYLDTLTGQYVDKIKAENILRDEMFNNKIKSKNEEIQDDGYSKVIIGGSENSLGQRNMQILTEKEYEEEKIITNRDIFSSFEFNRDELRNNYTDLREANMLQNQELERNRIISKSSNNIFSLFSVNR